jgi:superfamily II DNA or RNA helicase
MTKNIEVEPMLTLDIRSEIRLSGDIRQSILDDIKTRLTIINPLYLKNERLGYSTRKIERELSFIEKDGDALKIPRGFIYQLIETLNKHKAFFVVDFTKLCSFPDLEFSFEGELNEMQQNALKAILGNKKFGAISLPTGSGKTVLALNCIANRNQPALVIVHTKELLYQWRDEAVKFLNIESKDIGLIGDGKWKIGSKLTIAIINTLSKRVSEVVNEIGFLVVDECHHVPAKTFTDTIKRFKSLFMLGLSATPDRSDGLTPLIHFYLGDLLFNADSKEAQAKGYILRPKIISVKTEFDYAYNDDYPAMIKALVTDTKRNNLIINNINDYLYQKGGTALVVSDRKEHCETLKNLISKAHLSNALITGDISSAKRNEIIKKANSGELEVLIATTQIINEGFNCKKLDGLFLTTPIRSSLKLTQIVGRILRTDKMKVSPVIYDYVDRNPVLQASYQARMNAYEKIGVDYF